MYTTKKKQKKKKVHSTNQLEEFIEKKVRTRYKFKHETLFISKDIISQSIHKFLDEYCQQHTLMIRYTKTKTKTGSIKLRASIGIKQQLNRTKKEKEK